MLNEAFSAGARPGKVILKYYSNAIITTSCPLPGFYDFDRNFRFELPLPSEAYASRLFVSSSNHHALGGVSHRRDRLALAVPLTSLVRLLPPNSPRFLHLSPRATFSG